MACVDAGAVVSAAEQLFYVRLAQVFNGRTVALSGNEGWWTGERTGEWDPVAGMYKWSGERYVGAGTVATVTATGPGAFHIEFGYSLANLGSWEDVHGSGGENE